MTIIPAIDIIDGKCVRLSKGDFDAKTIYNNDPLEVAKEFQDHGLDRLHLVDLDGARSGSVKNWGVLEKIAAGTKLEIDFSGGVRDIEAVNRIFGLGAKYVAIGSIAVKDVALVSEWIEMIGADRFIIGADILEGKIAINGWRLGSEMEWKELISLYTVLGIRQFFCTDISKDGLLQGPAVALYTDILHCYPGIQLIASGGVSSIEDLIDLQNAGCAGAIVGKAIYENRVSLNELKQFNQ